MDDKGSPGTTSGTGRRGGAGAKAPRRRAGLRGRGRPAGRAAETPGQRTFCETRGPLEGACRGRDGTCPHSSTPPGLPARFQTGHGARTALNPRDAASPAFPPEPRTPPAGHRMPVPGDARPCGMSLNFNAEPCTEAPCCSASLSPAPCSHPSPFAGRTPGRLLTTAPGPAPHPHRRGPRACTQPLVVLWRAALAVYPGGKLLAAGIKYFI